jgi:hypothetical protein
MDHIFLLFVKFLVKVVLSITQTSLEQFIHFLNIVIDEVKTKLLEKMTYLFNTLLGFWILNGATTNQRKSYF